MLKILLCCGGGFSSSALVSRLKKEIIENNMDNEYSIEYSPFLLAKDKTSEFDVIVCCPHLIMSVNNLIKDYNPDIPIYIMPPRMYGLIKAKEVVQDARDVVDIYNKTKINPVHFPGEDKPLKITRSISYRNANPSYTG